MRQAYRPEISYTERVMLLRYQDHKGLVEVVELLLVHLIEELNCLTKILSYNLLAGREEDTYEVIRPRSFFLRSILNNSF
jgi:hypothetical protein